MQHSRTCAPRSNCKHFRIYILTRILRCVTCGGRLTAQSVRGNRYYRDRASLRSQPCTQPQTGVRAEEVEAQLDSIVARFRLLPTWRERVLDLISSRPERQKLQRERDRLEEKLRRLAKQYREVEIDEEEYRRDRDATRKKLNGFVVPAETEVLAAGAYLEDMVQVWSTATLEEKRGMALLIFDAIYYDVTAKEIAALKPKAAFIPVFRQSPSFVETSDGMFSIGGSDGGRLCGSQSCGRPTDPSPYTRRPPSAPRLPDLAQYPPQWQRRARTHPHRSAQQMQR